MRLVTPSRFTFDLRSDHRLKFDGKSGETFYINAVDTDIIRIQFQPDGKARLDRTWLVVNHDGQMPRNGRLRDDPPPFQPPSFTVDENPDRVRITTSSLSLDVHLENPHLTWHDHQQRPFLSDLPRRAYSYNAAGRDVYHYLRRRQDEHYYGFGEKAGPLSKVGMRMRMVNLDALGYDAETSDPLYKHVPFYITFIPELNIAYGLFYDNLATTIFDMGKEIDSFYGDYRYYHAADGDLDCYMIYGPTIEAVLEKYTRLTGYPMLPPRWSLGYLGSTMKYTEAPNAQEQLAQFARLCGEHQIPCDMFHLSSGYTTNPEGQRCVFTWNRERVPEPKQMVDNFHEAGIRLAANVKPYLLTTHPYYESVKAREGFITDGETGAPQTSTFWSGGEGEAGDGAYVDFMSESGYIWWQTQLQTQLFDYGIDAVWNDNNEFEIWNDEARCQGFGQPIPMGMARPLQTLLMAHASYHALLVQHPDQRPFVLSRAGCPGLQRYAQTWSGDNRTSWHDLRYNIAMGLGMSLSGIPNTGHDVGGFYGPKPEPELLTRWVQNHIFHPRFCIHSWNADGSVTEPWMYPDVLPIIRAAIRLRYQLIPYLYSLLFEAARTGHPIMRPLVYHFPHDPACHTESFDFMLGPFLLVATVLEQGARTRTIYLPQGTSWCNFHTGEWFDGDQTITVDAPLDHIPLFIRAGGILPMGKVMSYVGEQADDLRRLSLFPSPAANDSQFTLIEDDGISFGYQNGGYASLHVSLHSDAESIDVSVDIHADGFALPYDEITCIFPAGEGRQIHVAHGSAESVDDQGRRQITVPLKR